jgi:hypothetical protein
MKSVEFNSAVDINHIAQIMGHTNVDMLIHKYNKFIPAEVRKIDKSIGLF